MARILCLYYSQTGQLEKIARSVCGPLESHPDVELTMLNIKPKEAFPFPWPFTRFFNTFPETVYADAVKVEPLPLDDETLKSFDLVILAYQVWFLTPSLPIASFLQTDQAKVLFKDKPVMTLIGCRNMWLMAQEQMKSWLDDLGARLIDNAVLIDSASTAWSFVSTPLWMLTGNKGPNAFIPAAGVSEEDIANASRFGKAIVQRVESGQGFDSPMLKGLGAVFINENLIMSEKGARKGFLAWGRLIRFIGRFSPALRTPIVYLYVLYLITLILTFVPITAVLKKIFAPLMQTKIKKQVEYFSHPSGCDVSNIERIE